MGADLIAELRPPIREVLTAGPPTDSANLCATFKVDRQPNVWVQVTFELVNVFYPVARKPTEELAMHKLIPANGVMLVAWEHNKYATFSHSRNVDDIAAFIDAYLSRVCMKGCENYALNVTLQNLS